jgi:hypothetical protein
MNFTTETSSSKLLNFVASLISERDGIHLAHAMNRIRAACMLLDAIDVMGESTDVLDDEWQTHVLDNGWQMRRQAVASRAGVQASNATWSVAAEIYNAEWAALEMMA